MTVGSKHGGLDRGRIAPLALALLVAAYLAFSPALFNDGDTSWHLAAGRLILASRHVPETDPFSYTFAGHSWTAHEWLAEVLMAAVFGIASWGGLAVLTAGAVGVTLLLIGNELRRWLPPQRVILVLVLVVALLAPFLLARPHVLAWPLLTGWAIVLLRARAAHRAPPIAAVLLMMLWANAHASAIFGIALAGVFALEALIAEPDRQRALTGWALFGVASLAAALLTPHGVRGLLYPFQVSGMTALPMIVEWRRTTFSQDWLFMGIAAATALLLLVRRAPVPPVRVLLMLGVVYLAMTHVRHQPLVAILGALILADPLARAMAAPHRPARNGVGAVAAVFAIGLALIATARLSIVIPRQDSASNPVTAIARLPAALRERPVLNSYGFGGPLIFAGIRPFIDGRGDMYGDAFMIEHGRIVGGDPAALERAVRRWDIGWTMLEPGTKLIDMLDRSPGWRRVYADRWAVVHVRR